SGRNRRRASLGISGGCNGGEAQGGAAERGCAGAKNTNDGPVIFRGAERRRKSRRGKRKGAGTGPGNRFLVRKRGSQSGIDGSAGPLFLGGTKCKSSGQRNHQLSRFFPTGSELSSAGLYGLPGWGK